MTKAFALAHAFTAQWKGDFKESTFNGDDAINQGVSAQWFAQLEKEVRQDFIASAATCDGSNTWDTYACVFSDDHESNAQDIEACSDEQAALLLHKYFWKPIFCKKMPLPIGIVVYDTAVNIGSAKAISLLQRACNMVGEAHLDTFTALAEDGVCGTKTIAMCKALQECGLDFYTARFMVRQRMNFYTKLTHNIAEPPKLLKVWKKRCTALLQYLADLEREI